jgi:hypothetical protein
MSQVKGHTKSMEILYLQVPLDFPGKYLLHGSLSPAPTLHTFFGHTGIWKDNEERSSERIKLTTPGPVVQS